MIIYVLYTTIKQIVYYERLLKNGEMCPCLHQNKLVQGAHIKLFLLVNKVKLEIFNLKGKSKFFTHNVSSPYHGLIMNCNGMMLMLLHVQFEMYACRC